MPCIFICTLSVSCLHQFWLQKFYFLGQKLRFLDFVLLMRIQGSQSMDFHFIDSGSAPAKLIMVAWLDVLVLFY